MKNIFILLFSVFSLGHLAGQDTANLKKEIDQQIWYPFMQAWNNFDAEAFNEIHADNMLRGTPRNLRSGKDYKSGNLKNFLRAKERGDVRNISFTFEYRVHEKFMAYEVGYYKIESMRSGEKNFYYGQFHVVLNKIGERWKIVQDWDADSLNGIEIGEEHFMKFSHEGIYKIDD